MYSTIFFRFVKCFNEYSNDDMPYFDNALLGTWKSVLPADSCISFSFFRYSVNSPFFEKIYRKLASVEGCMMLYMGGIVNGC